MTKYNINTLSNFHKKSEHADRIKNRKGRGHTKLSGGDSRQSSPWFVARCGWQVPLASSRLARYVFRGVPVCDWEVSCRAVKGEGVADGEWLSRWCRRRHMSLVVHAPCASVCACRGVVWRSCMLVMGWMGWYCRVLKVGIGHPHSQ